MLLEDEQYKASSEFLLLGVPLSLAVKETAHVSVTVCVSVCTGLLFSNLSYNYPY